MQDSYRRIRIFLTAGAVLVCAARLATALFAVLLLERHTDLHQAPQFARWLWLGVLCWSARVQPMDLLRTAQHATEDSREQSTGIVAAFVSGLRTGVRSTLPYGWLTMPAVALGVGTCRFWVLLLDRMQLGALLAVLVLGGVFAWLGRIAVEVGARVLCEIDAGRAPVGPSPQRQRA